MRRVLLLSLLGLTMLLGKAQTNTKVRIIERMVENNTDTTVIINKGDTLIRIREPFFTDSVVVTTKRFNINIGSTGLSIVKNDSTAQRRVVTRFLLMDIGFAGFLQNGSFNLTPENEFLDSKSGKSRNINLQLFTQRVRFANNHMNFSYGLMFEFNKYRLTNDIKLIPGESPLAWEDSDTDYRKNKLKATYLYMPLMIGVESNPDKIARSFRVRAGVYGGILVNSKQKLIGKITDREKIKDDFNLTKFRYGIRGEIGYGFVNFYVHYGLNGMFKGNQGPDLSPINFGFMLLPF